MKTQTQGADKTEVARKYLQATCWMVLLSQPAFGALGLSTQSFTHNASEMGELLLEANAFLRESGSRGNSLYTLTVHPDFKMESEHFTGRIDLYAVTLISDRSSFTLDPKQAYLATSREFTGNHELGFGRRDLSLSAMDAFWKTGTWTPRFLWSPMKPENMGTFAGYYQFERNAFRFVAYGSPFSIPERGYPVQTINGQLTSSSPDWVPPFKELSLLGQKVDIQYELIYPEMRELLLEPTYGVHARYGNSTGFWIQGGVAQMPLHQVELALDASLKASTMTLDAKIHPRRNAHLLSTLETGYQGENFGIWGSYTRENLLAMSRSPEEAEWIAAPMGPSQLASLGVQTSFMQGMRLDLSWLWVQESLPAPVPGEITLTTPSRYPFEQAARFRAIYSGYSPVRYAVEWTLDIPNQSSLTTLDLEYGHRSGITLGVGADMISSSTGQGFIGQYFGNDRVRGRIAYAF